MPSLGDSAVIIFIGLLLFGPKGLAQIARQLGKLMGEFRRASNEFRMQMEEELRISEQAERQKQIAAIEAAAPAVPPILAAPVEENRVDAPQLDSPISETVAEPIAAPTPVPIATSGDLSIMPPATGLPAPRSSSLSSLINAVPQVAPPGTAAAPEAASPLSDGSDERPMRYTHHRSASAVAPIAASDSTAAEESVHG